MKTKQLGVIPNEIQKTINNDGTAIIADLKVWYLAPNRFATVLKIKPLIAQTSGYYHNLLEEIRGLVFVSIEQKF